MPNSRLSALAGRTILVVEDDYFLAQEIARKIRSTGASLLGPVSNVDDALDVLAETASIDGAILDLNLMGETAYPIADALRLRNTPFVFVTGYDVSHMSPEYRNVPCLQKPVELDSIARALFG